MAAETHCHADGAGPCLAGDCPIARQGPLAGHLRPCPGAPGPQHAVATKDFPRAHLDRWVSGPPAGAPSLPDFLLARYAEDEAVARETIAWGTRNGGDNVDTGTPWCCDEQSTHVAVAPARVLADIEAKRRIVEELAIPYIAERRRLMNGQPSWGDEHPELLRWLALPYADHPDYREEWKL